MTEAPVKKNKYRTGWCGMGQCEGTKKKSISGKPLHTCTDYLTCPCKCHERITQMCELTGTDRPVPEQSAERMEYLAETQLASALMLADVRRMTPLSNASGASTPSTVESPVDGNGDPATGTIPAARPTFQPTPTGIRPKGQLEYDVLKICVDFHNQVYDENVQCTPKLISNEIAKMHTAEPPSTGAVNAVLERWDKLKFIAFFKKPTRFESILGFEDEVSLYQASLVLDTLKAQAKRAKKMTHSANRRGANLDLAGRKAARKNGH